jgi:hypothetical protein
LSKKPAITVREQIREVAKVFAGELKKKIDARTDEMLSDDTSHFLIYRVLGITNEEGILIDSYQNKGRFLYKYAGTFLEQAAKLCFKSAFPESGSLRIINTLGTRPKTFEIDCVVGNEAIEIKWRDATTDGDHITKEHTRLRNIHAAGYVPIRVMFYYPNRDQAIKIQKALEALYKGMDGFYFFGDAAWEYVAGRTGVKLKEILEELAAENTAKK